MSVFTSLKNIDPIKYATTLLLDAMGIDVDPEDGRIYFSEDPLITIDINDRILRLDLGRPNRKVEYVTYNPILREDHAQYLMTLSIYSQIFEELITPDEAKDTDFEVYTEIIIEEKNKAVMIPSTMATIVRNHDEVDVKGVGIHPEASVAIVLAVVDYMDHCGLVSGKTKELINESVVSAFADYERLQEQKMSERKKEIRERTQVLAHDEKELEEYTWIDEDTSSYKDEEDDFIENDDTYDMNLVTFSDSDFNDVTPIDQDSDWIDDDLSTNELIELFGEVIHMDNPEFELERENTSYIPDEYNNSSEFTDYPEIVSNMNLGSNPMTYIDPIYHQDTMYQQQMQFPQLFPQQPISVSTSPLPELKFEDLVSKDDLDKINERNTKRVDTISIEDWVNKESICLNDFTGMSQGTYIP